MTEKESNTSSIDNKHKVEKVVINIKLSPSIYAVDIVRLESVIKEIENADAEMLHIDVMDGHFVKGMAYGQAHLSMLNQHTKLPLDVHLMVKDPERIIAPIAEAGASIITVHQESTTQLKTCLQKIKAQGCKAGVALNPATLPETIKYILDDIDMVLIMTVNPGEGGQPFFEDMIDKIKETKALLADRSIDVEVDGSIDDYWAFQCAKAGANVFVSGSYLFKGSLIENIQTIRKKLSEAEGVSRL